MIYAYLYATLCILLTETHVECDSTPKPNVLQLSPGCVQSDGTSTYDVGRCSYSQCGGQLLGDEQTLCLDPDEFCCSVNETELVAVPCSGYEILLQKVVSCSCKRCEMLPARISGRVVSAEDSSPVPLAFIYINEEKVTNTNLQGLFQWEGKTAQTRISLHFRDEFFENFVSTSKVVNVASGSSLFVTVRMKSTPESFQILSSVENTIPLIGDYFDPVAEIVVAPNSFYNENGESYDGQVNVFVTNIDMRKESDLETAPGDFTVKDKEGNTIKVQSFGIFMLDFGSIQGQKLLLGGEVPLYVDHDIVPIAFGDRSMNVGILNKRTGSWETHSQFVRNDSKRRRKQIDRMVANIEIIPNEHYSINTEYINNELCFAKIVPYSSDLFLSSDMLPNVQFVSSLVDTTNPFFQYTETWSNPGSWWNGGPGACVAVACTLLHAHSIESIISAHIDQTYLTPASQNTQNSIPSILSILPDIDYGIHLRNSSTSLKLTVRKSSITYQDPPGPLYAFDEEKVCLKAGFESLHFQFHSIPTAPVAPILKLNTQAEQTCHLGPGTLDTPYSFYPRNGEYECPSHSCFIRVKILSSLETIRIVAKSYASDETIFRDNIPPIMYGLRAVYAVQDVHSLEFEACVEFKCPGLVFEEKSLLGVDLMTTINLEVWDNEDNIQLCHVCANSEHFLSRVSYANETSADKLPLCGMSVTGVRTPVEFRLPYFIDAEAGVYGNDVNVRTYDFDFHNLDHCTTTQQNSALTFTCQ